MTQPHRTPRPTLHEMLEDVAHKRQHVHAVLSNLLSMTVHHPLLDALGMIDALKTVLEFEPDGSPPRPPEIINALALLDQMEATLSSLSDEWTERAWNDWGKQQDTEPGQ